MRNVLRSAAAAFMVWGLLAPASVMAFTGSYEETISLAEKPIAHFRVYSKDKKVRTEFLMESQSEIILRNDKGIFRYSSQQKMALKLPDLSPQQQTLLDHLDDYLGFLQKNGAVKKGSETLGEYQTDVYEFLDPMTQKNAKAWVWQEKSFPLKIVIDAPEGQLSVELKDIKIGGEVADNLFEVPENTKIIDLNEVYGPKGSEGGEGGVEASDTSAPAQEPLAAEPPPAEPVPAAAEAKAS